MASQNTAAPAKVRAGCQTITWGEEQRHHFPAVFREVADAGYTGVEIGFRHLRDTPPERLSTLLQENDLVLLAAHLGGILEDPAQASAERIVLEEAMDYIGALGTELLIYSGLRFRDESQFARDLAALNRVAVRCGERGVRLLYHNHDWEFHDNGRIIKALLNHTEPALQFCPDIGWIAKSGASVPDFLVKAKERIAALHFKDFAGPGAVVDTVVLGEGFAPLEYAARWMRDNLPADAWAIAEQDRTSLPPREAAARNARYLKGLFV